MRLIDADKFGVISLQGKSEEFIEGVKFMLEKVDEAPTVERPHGEWRDNSDMGFVECPFCEHATTCDDNIDELHYCFFCGAELRKREWWIFTFGCGQQHAGKYVKIYGTYGEARSKMFEKYGEEWCFQYSEQEWNKWKNDENRTWSMETELEVIGEEGGDGK